MDSAMSEELINSTDKQYHYFLYSIVLLGGISFLLMFYLLRLEVFQGLFSLEIPALGRDFQPHYYAAVAFRNEGLPSPMDIPYPFCYFPLVIFYYLPLTYLSFYSAFSIITVWNLLMALVMAIFITKILTHYQVRLPAMGKWVIFFGIIFFCPVTASLNSGNVNTVVAGFITIFYFALCIKGNNIHAGVTLVIATLLKIFPATLLFFAIVKGKFKLIIVFLLVSTLCLITSIALLGLPAHITFAKYLLFANQGVEKAATGCNSAFSGIIYNSLEFFNVRGGIQNIIHITWAFGRVAFVLLALGYLYRLFKKGGTAFRDKEWTILSFSLFSVLMVSFPNHAWVYYTSCLVLPFILCIFCLKLDYLEKIIITLSIALFSFNVHISTICSLAGGTFFTLNYIVPPSVIGNLLFLTFVLLKMARLKQAGNFLQVIGVRK